MKVADTVLPGCKVSPGHKADHRRAIASSRRRLVQSVLLRTAIFVAVCHFAENALAHSHKQNGIEIVHPWCFPNGPQAAGLAIYMVIRNLKTQGDRLLGARSVIAASVELREAAPNDPNNTRALKAVAARAGQELVLKAKGPHLVLYGIKTELAAFDAFPLTLIFEKAGSIDVEVLVEERQSH